MWIKLLKRENVDITTISGIDVAFIESIWKFTKNKRELFFTYFNKKTFAHYVNIDLYEWGISLYKIYFNTPQKIKKHYQEGKLIKKRISQQTRLYQSKINQRNNLVNLLMAYREFEEEFKKINRIYSIFSWLAIEAWQLDFDKMVAQIIKKNNLENERDKIINLAYSLWRPTAINKLQKELKQNKNIKNLIEKYQFLRSWSLIWYRPLNKRWINDLIKAGISQTKHKKHFKQTLYKKLKLNSKEKKNLEIAPYIIFFKDWRDDLRRFFCYKWLFLFQAIGKYFSLDYSDLGYLTLDEIREALIKNKIDKKIIDKRKDNPCVITTEKEILKIKVLTNKKELNRYKKLIQRVEKTRNIKIQGLVGNKGIIKGKVKIIKTYHDIKRFNKGEILVTNTTHPNYLPMLQKAAAFVTNEGGVISHAAIVARELDKPCIVGTKIATQVLKDGDLVEVDANKGVVTILN